MRLLVITQVMDKNHPILGFFHRWVEELAKHTEKIYVICLEEGTYSLPPNVAVHSLGKESGKGRVTYLLRFFKYIWVLRKEYDNVFVHMNQVYVILGAPLWRFYRKKVGLWYAHGTVSPSLRLATVFAHIIFTSTPEGFRIGTSKKVIIGQGIDTALFTSGKKAESDRLRLITVGRISSSKNIDTLLRACAILRNKGVQFHFKIVGVATTENERTYEKYVKQLSSELTLNNYVEWTGAVSQSELPSILQESDIFIHDGATNSLDKALLEASLCGCIVVSSNPAYRMLSIASAPDLLFQPKDYHMLAHLIQNKEHHRDAEHIRKLIFEKYDISNLAKSISDKY